MLPVISKADAPDYETLSISQLQDEASRLATVLELVNQQRRDIFDVIEKRKAEVAAQLRVSAMNNVQRDALRSVLDK